MENKSLKYRVKFSYALGMTCLFVLFTLGSVMVGLNTKSMDLSLGIIAVPITLYLFYVSKVLKDDSGAKWLQLGISTIAGIGTVLAIILLGGKALAVVGVGLFGVLGAYYIWVNLISRQPLIQADNDKLLLHNGFFRGRNTEIPWDNIENLSVRTQNLYSGNKMKYLIVKLVDPERFKQQNSSKTLAKFMAMNEKMYGGQLAAVVSHLDTNEREVLTRLKEYINKP